MFNSKSNHAFGDLFKGILIGGSLAAVATFLFGTKKGKELQKELVHQYKKLGHTTERMEQKVKKTLKTHPVKKAKRLIKAKTKQPRK